MAREPKTQGRDTPSSSIYQEDGGCLIEPSTLRVGDILFHISRGKVEVTYIEMVQRVDYPIGFKYLNGGEREGDTPIKADKQGHDCCNYKGMLYHDDVYPCIYKKDPFKYTFNKLKEKEVELDLVKTRLRARRFYETQEVMPITEINPELADRLKREAAKNISGHIFGDDKD